MATFGRSGMRRPRAPDSQSGPRGAPGGTVGTTTGRPQGLNPAPMRGEASAGRRRKSPRRALGRAPPNFRTNRTALVERPPPPRLQQEARSAARDRGGRQARPGSNKAARQGSKDAQSPALPARGNAGPCPGRGAARSDAPLNRDPMQLMDPGSAKQRRCLPGRFAPRRLSRCIASGEQRPALFRHSGEGRNPAPPVPVVMAGLVPAIHVFFLARRPERPTRRIDPGSVQHRGAGARPWNDRQLPCVPPPRPAHRQRSSRHA